MQTALTGLIVTKGQAWYRANRDRVLAEKKAEYAADPEAKKAKSAAYREANADRVRTFERQRGAQRRTDQEFRRLQRERAKAWYVANRERVAERSRRDRLRQYGLTVDDYEAMVVAQGGRCGVCRQIPESSLVVDHCHETGLVRGLLCDGCNTAIGRLGDTADGLQRAYSYLARFEDAARVADIA